jgi:hypothetical protein
MATGTGLNKCSPKFPRHDSRTARSWSMTTSHSISDDPRASRRRSEVPAGSAFDPPLGAHLVTRRRGYAHHGIYAGDGRVIHYAGWSRSWQRGPVEEIALSRFAAGRPVLIKPAAEARYRGAEIVARARSRLGEDRYRITRNNCEHFCEWCIHGQPRSEQVESLLATPWLALLRRLPRVAQRFAADPVEIPDDTCAA